METVSAERASRFLLVSADSTAKTKMEKLLRAASAGSSLDYAARVDEALPNLETQSYAAVFGDGVALCIELLDHARSRERFAPLVALVSPGEQEVGRALLDGGAADFLVHDALDTPLLARSLRYVFELQRLKKHVHQGDRRESQLVCLLESLDDAVWSGTLDGIVTIWNHGAEKLYGYSAAEVVGQSFSLIIPAERAGEKEFILDYVRRGERLTAFPTIRQHKNGKRIPILLSVSPIFDSAGNILGASAVAHDVSEQKQAQEALRRSEEYLRAFLEHTPASVFIRDEEGRYVYLNKAVEQVVHTPAKELLGKTIFDRMPEEFARPLHENSMKVLHSGRAQEFEEVVYRPGGQLCHEIVVKFPLVDADGRRLVAGVAIDITRRKQIEVELQKERDFISAVVETVNSLVVIFDCQGRVVRFNRACERVSGYSFEEIKGSTALSILVPPEELDEVRAVFDRLCVGQSPFSHENFWVSKNGSRHLISWSNAVLRGADGAVEFIIGTGIDISERRRIQEERDRFFSLSDDMFGIFGFDGRFKQLNPSWQKVLGYSNEELLAHPYIDLVHPDDREMTLMEAERIGAGGQGVSFENRYRCRDGSYKWIQWRSTPDPVTALIYAVATDVTGHKQVQTNLHASQNRLLGIVNSAMDAIISVDEAQTIQLFNPAAEKIFGYQSAQVLGKTLDLLIPRLFQDQLQVEAFGRGEQTNLRMGEGGGVRAVRSSGEEFPVEASISQVMLDGQKLFTVVLRDITEREQAESALRNSRERLQAALDGGQVGLWDWDIENNRVEFSTQWKSQLGFEDHEITDSTFEWQNRLHPEDRDVANQRLEQFLNGEMPEYRSEFRMRHKDGSYRWILGRAALFSRADGTRYRMMGSHVDITQLKQTEEELLASRAQLQQAHDELELRVSQRTVELAKSNQTLHAEIAERQMAVGVLREVVVQVENAREQTEAANAQLLAGQEQMLRANRVFAQLSHLRATTHAEIEQALHQITEAGSEILDVERCSVWLFNPDQTAMSCLDLFERSEARHTNGAQIREQDYPIYFRALKTQRNVVAHDALTHESMSEFTDSYHRARGIASVLKTTILVGGQHIGALCYEHIGEPRAWTLEEETFSSSAAALCSLALESYERARVEEALLRAKEEAERANAAKSEFLSRMSHELRTPMNSILGFAQIMEMNPTNEKQAQRVAHILKAGHHLLQLINEVLDLARVESGRLSLSLEPVSVAHIVQSSVDIVRPLCQKQELTIDSASAAVSPLFVLADQQRLSQVLLNLLSNATKYNRRGGEVRVTLETREANRLRIIVSDTGTGIAAEDLERLFHPFQRLDAEGSSIEGTGLGLALSKRLIEAMDGAIGVNSTVGEGSQFWVELPFTQAPLPKMAPAQIRSVAPKMTESGHVILYIEDNLANISVMEGVLEPLGNLRLVSAMQGELGLEMARQHRPSVILLDLHLPDVPGEEILRRLRAEPLLQATPVVIVSADATAPQRELLMKMGAAAYLTKPLDVRQFLEVLQGILQQHEVHHEPHK